MMLMMGLYSGVVYANDSGEAYNIETTTVVKDGQEVEILQSQDKALQITQIGQNSKSVKIATSTFNERILISGRAKQGTSLKFEIYQGEDCLNTYDTSVGITETFSQMLDLVEGNNKVFLYYTNGENGIEGYVTVFIERESTENMEELMSWLDVPNL